MASYANFGLPEQAQRPLVISTPCKILHFVQNDRWRVRLCKKTYHSERSEESLTYGVRKTVILSAAKNL